MSEAEFSSLLPMLKRHTDYIYLHLMGEPLCHPKLGEFLRLSKEAELRVIITTNGTLLGKRGDLLLGENAPHKVNISLHAYEANDLDMPLESYLDACFDFGKAAHAAQKTVTVFRLWNEGGADALNEEIKSKLESRFPETWVKERNGIRIADKVYLEHGDKFDWPDLSAQSGGESVFCYGLRDQIGILSDGTVVPCCLDHNGDIALGNAFDTDLDDIIASPRARDIYNGFTARRATEELCRRCGYARRFG